MGPTHWGGPFGATINTDVILANGGKVGAASGSVTVEKNAAATLVGNAAGSVTVSEGANVTLDTGVTVLPRFTGETAKARVAVKVSIGEGATTEAKLDHRVGTFVAKIQLCPFGGHLIGCKLS